MDWDEVQRRTGWNEEDWKTEVSEENPMCPILDWNGHLPAEAVKMKHILVSACNFCPLYAEPCPWVVRMAEELLEAELI